MNRRKGFTLLELIIVVIIIGILAAVAIPQYVTAVEKAKAGKAVNGLGLIRQAETLYRSANDVYIDVAMGGFAAPVPLGDFVELDGIDADLDWSYSVGGSTANTFMATAARTGGPNDGLTITIDQTGVVTPDPGVTAWKLGK